MPKSYKKKLLGEWPYKEKHEEVESPEEQDSESALGHEVASGSDEVGDVEEIAESMGIYDETKNPKEVSIADEIEKNNEG